MVPYDMLYSDIIKYEYNISHNDILYYTIQYYIILYYTMI